MFGERNLWGWPLDNGRRAVWLSSHPEGGHGQSARNPASNSGGSALNDTDFHFHLKPDLQGSRYQP
jgi:hypothetical protein